MIPKKIHYCWFGPNPIPQEFKCFINGWSKKMPDYEIKLWNENNSPMEIPYLKKAHKNKKWANISNYIRLHAIYEEGGIYLDTDVEVIKSFDPLLSNQCFFGLQRIETDLPNSFNNAIFGASPNHYFINKLKESLKSLYDGTEIAYLSSPHLTTFLLKEEGYSGEKQHELISDNIQIYPPSYFFPYHWEEEFSQDKITQDTFAVHYWSGTWANSHPKHSSIYRKIIQKVFKF